MTKKTMKEKVLRLIEEINPNSEFLTDEKWIGAIFVSVSRTLVGTILGVFFTCLVAYAMSFEDLKLRKFYYGIMIVCMYFSGGLIPYYLVIRELGLLNTFWVYVIPGMFSIYNMSPCPKRCMNRHIWTARTTC